jgi:hypothetical protein
MKKASQLVLAMPLPPAADHVIGGAQLSWRKRAIIEIEGQRPPDHLELREHARVRLLAGFVHGRSLVEIISAALGLLADVGVIMNLSVISRRRDTLGQDHRAGPDAG